MYLLEFLFFNIGRATALTHLDQITKSLICYTYVLPSTEAVGFA